MHIPVLLLVHLVQVVHFFHYRPKHYSGKPLNKIGCLVEHIKCPLETK